MMQRNVMARACVAAGVLILAACGGGGGADTPAATGGDAPLSLSPSNAAQASVEAMGFGGVALGLGQQAVDWIAAADAAGGDVVTTTCVSGGTQTVTLNDLDGNHRVSAGDRLLVQMNNCFLPPLDDAFDGTLTIDVAVPIAPLQQAGTITFGSVFDVRVAGGSVRLGGGLRYEYAADRLAKSVRVASNTSSFTITVYSGTRTIAEILTRLDATRTVRRDTARSTTTMQYHLASDALGGAVEVATAVPWSAWFDSYPDAGELSLIGAGATSASLRASSQGGALFEVRAGGALAGTVTAYEASSGYLWSGTGWVTQSNVLPGSSYNIWEASSIGFKQFSQPLVAVLQPSPGPLTWGYSRPLAAGTLTSATFVQTRLPPGQNGAPVNIPATLNIEGALLSVTPMTQLEPGAAYELVFDNSYLVPVSDTTGATAPRPSLSATVALTIAASAREGQFLATGDPDTIVLRLTDGMLVHEGVNFPTPRVLTFTAHDLPIDLPKIEEFRRRGGADRELTIPELAIVGQDEDAPLATRLESRANFHFRLVEVVAMFVLPLLAIALAIPPKRSTSALGVFLAIIMLVTQHKINEYAEDFGALGRIDPFLALWIPFALFCVLTVWMFYTIAFVPGGQPISGLERGFAKISSLIALLWRRRRPELA